MASPAINEKRIDSGEALRLRVTHRSTLPTKIISFFLFVGLFVVLIWFFVPDEILLIKGRELGLSLST